MDPSLTTVVPDAAAAGQLSPADVPPKSSVSRSDNCSSPRDFLDNAQLDQALHVGSQTGERLGEVVVRQGLASEEDIARLLAEQWDLSYVDRASIWFDANALARLSREDAQRLEAMPTRVEDGRVVVAVAEPTEQRLAALREVIGEDTVSSSCQKRRSRQGSTASCSRATGGRRRSPPVTTSLTWRSLKPTSHRRATMTICSRTRTSLAEAIALEMPAYAKNRPAPPAPPRRAGADARPAPIRKRPRKPERSRRASRS